VEDALEISLERKEWRPILSAYSLRDILFNNLVKIVHLVYRRQLKHRRW
jgi:hypothetical protein